VVRVLLPKVGAQQRRLLWLGKPVHFQVLRVVLGAMLPFRLEDSEEASLIEHVGGVFPRVPVERKHMLTLV
jgi:hypothetical protein